MGQRASRRPWTGWTGELIGAAHPDEHAYLRREGRSGFLVRERATGRVHGYVYGSGGGRLGPRGRAGPGAPPVADRRGRPRDAHAGRGRDVGARVGDRATRALLDAGLRFDGIPGLICWSRPDHPFERYVPISLALV